MNYGDGCPGPLAGLSSPQGAAVDKLGNVYVADYSDRLVRVVYQRRRELLAAAITAANSGYTIPGTTPRSGPGACAGCGQYLHHCRHRRDAHRQQHDFEPVHRYERQ